MSFFTIPAPHCDRKCSEARFGDLVAAFEAPTVGAIIETAERHVDLVQCFRFQLEQRELDLILDVDLGAFTFVEHFALPSHRGQPESLGLAGLACFLQFVFRAQPIFDVTSRFTSSLFEQFVRTEGDRAPRGEFDTF
jgi:hypothetical protein